MREFLFNGYALYQGKIVFKDSKNGLLCELDIDTGKINCIENLMYYQMEISSLDCMIEHKGKLYGMQNDGNGMMIYDGTERMCQWINMNCCTRPWGNFTNVFSFEETLFFFHREERRITCYDILSNCTDKIIFENGINSVCSCRIGNEVWMFPEEGNTVQVFNLETRNSIFHELSSPVSSVVGCTRNDDNIYLLQKFGLIYVLNKTDLSIEIIDLAWKEEMSNAMGKILYVSNRIILLPSAGDDIKVIELDKNKVDVYSDYPVDFIYDDIVWSKYSTVCQDDEYYYLLRKSNYLLKIRKDDGKFVWIGLQAIDKEVEARLLFKYSKDVIWESYLDIYTLIENVSVIDKRNMTMNKSVGKEIWKKYE